MAKRRWLVAVVVPLGIAGPSIAFAATDAGTGGAGAPEPAAIEKLACGGTAWSCAPGDKLVVTGSGLDGVQAIEFAGGRGQSDDRTARPRKATPERLVAVVPSGARSGTVRAITYDRTARAPQSLTVTAAPQSKLGNTAGGGGVFPIDGLHDMGQSEANRFGGGRGHQGQDMFAKCGTPVVAVLDTTVQFVGNQSAAGNYAVIQDSTGRSYAYMHLRDRPLVRKGDKLSAGERIGFVGDTGRASGCHLHFELWTAPGWYEGGEAIDPLPRLRSWEREHDHSQYKKK